MRQIIALLIIALSACTPKLHIRDGGRTLIANTEPEVLTFPSVQCDVPSNAGKEIGPVFLIFSQAPWESPRHLSISKTSADRGCDMSIYKFISARDAHKFKPGAVFRYIAKCQCKI